MKLIPVFADRSPWDDRTSRTPGSARVHPARELIRNRTHHVPQGELGGCGSCGSSENAEEIEFGTCIALSISEITPTWEAPMGQARSLALAVLVYGGCLGMTAVTPAKADAQIVTSYYSTPYVTNYGVYPAGYGVYNYAYPVYPVYPSYPIVPNWGGNTTPSGYPQWYVNYVRWNSPNYNPYYNPYRGFPGRRW
ncbi:MAG: hypothetical protein C0467_23695 [Planctomycetaceae bacterium]|nr:hypothetical protein [Planctomycetaceae bacterium]